MAIKDVFKINYLEKIGYSIITLHNNFEKLGEGASDKFKRESNSKSIVDSWPAYGIFSDNNAIRTYFGDSVGFEIQFSNTLMWYFSIVTLSFTLLYIIENIFSDQYYIYTTQL